MAKLALADNYQPGSDGIDILEAERKIREKLQIDETSPSGLRWNHLAGPRGRNKPAGGMGTRGYWLIGLSVHGKLRQFVAHRIVWFLTHGRWPKEQIDHINGNRADNRLSNLREASNGDNQQNQGMRANNTSGVKGVYFCRSEGMWRAQLTHKSKKIFIGRFTDIIDAENAVRATRERLHGEFANHGTKPSNKEHA